MKMGEVWRNVGRLRARLFVTFERTSFACLLVCSSARLLSRSRLAWFVLSSLISHTSLYSIAFGLVLCHSSSNPPCPVGILRLLNTLHFHTLSYTIHRPIHHPIQAAMTTTTTAETEVEEAVETHTAIATKAEVTNADTVQYRCHTTYRIPSSLIAIQKPSRTSTNS